MKLRNIFLASLGLLLAFVSCKVDELDTNFQSFDDLSLVASLVSDDSKTYDAVIDNDANTITVQVPFYISDTETIQGDLTKMKLYAHMPSGSKFNPGLDGIRDMVTGFTSKLTLPNGKSKVYEIKAEYCKSDAAKITKFDFQGFKAIYSVYPPESKDSKGKIVIFKTSSSLASALKNVKLEVSPWAKVKNAKFNSTTQTYDLSNLNELIVEAQNGNNLAYTISIQDPKLVDSGNYGTIAAIFGIQPTVQEPHGFTGSDNRTMAIVDDYLILSNSTDVTKMVFLNRWDGSLENVNINTSGMDISRSYHAISNDEANHLVAATFTSLNESSMTASDHLKIYVWENGIQNAPKLIFDKSLKDEAFANYRGRPMEVARTIAVKGDLTSGDAAITTVSKNVIRTFFLFFKDGVFNGPVGIYKDVKEGFPAPGVNASMWNATKSVPLSAKAPVGFIWDTASNNWQNIAYIPVGNQSTRGFAFTLPKNKHWWNTGSRYGNNTRSLDYIEFNGMNLLAVSNGYLANGQTYQRLYVANITASPTTTSLVDGFIFDSRCGDDKHGEEKDGGPVGTGFSPSGMTSSYPFGGSNFTILDVNADQTGDVRFAKSPDGNAVQVYMLVTGQGLLAYEITRYDL